MAFRCVRLLYFQRSIKHSLSEESKQRQEFTDRKFSTAVTTSCLSLISLMLHVLCVLHPQTVLKFLNHLSCFSSIRDTVEFGAFSLGVLQ